MGFKDILRKGSGMDLLNGTDEAQKTANVGERKPQKEQRANKDDDKVLKQLESDLSRAIEKLQDARDKLRVRRGY